MSSGVSVWMFGESRDADSVCCSLAFVVDGQVVRLLWAVTNLEGFWAADAAWPAIEAGVLGVGDALREGRLQAMDAAQFPQVAEAQAAIAAGHGFIGCFEEVAGSVRAVTH